MAAEQNGSRWRYRKIRFYGQLERGGIEKHERWALMGEFSGTSKGRRRGFLVWGVGKTSGVARTVDAVLWENSDFFMRDQRKN